MSTAAEYAPAPAPAARRRAPEDKTTSGRARYCGVPQNVRSELFSRRSSRAQSR